MEKLLTACLVIAASLVWVQTTNVEHPLKLNITGATLSGKGTVWRLASAENNGQNPGISRSPVDSIPHSLTRPRFSVSIYELPANQAPKH